MFVRISAEQAQIMEDLRNVARKYGNAPATLMVALVSKLLGNMIAYLPDMSQDQALEFVRQNVIQGRDEALDTTKSIKFDTGN